MNGQAGVINGVWKETKNLADINSYIVHDFSVHTRKMNIIKGVGILIKNLAFEPDHIIIANGKKVPTQTENWSLSLG